MDALTKTLQQLLDLAKSSPEIDKKIDQLEKRIDQLSENEPAASKGKFEFELENDSAGFADASWEKIISQGQSLQAPYRDKSETYWYATQGKSPSGAGWYGSFECPKIVIKATEPVYRFRNTARLPGSFQISSHAHMGSVLRFLGDGQNSLVDDNGWWHQTNSSVGLYVEPSTIVSGRDIRNFEQSISNITIVGQKGTMPIYIADNAFNFRISDCNIQAHQGSRIIIKHGPSLSAYWYPAIQKPSGNNYLPDPIIKDCLIEGCHKWDRRNLGVAMSGNNIQFHGLNFYGCVTGILSTGQGRTVSGCTLHHGATHDGRTWAMRDQLALGFLSRRPHENEDAIQTGGSFPVINPIKRTRAEKDLGWYKRGELYI